MKAPEDQMIAIFDDEDFILNITSRVLKNLGYRHIETANSLDNLKALLEAQSMAIDILLCDLNIPQTPMSEIFSAIAQTDFRGSVVLYSSTDIKSINYAQALAESFGVHVLGAIAKPLNCGELQRLVDSHQP